MTRQFAGYIHILYSVRYTITLCVRHFLFYAHTHSHNPAQPTTTTDSGLWSISFFVWHIRCQRKWCTHACFPLCRNGEKKSRGIMVMSRNHCHRDELKKPFELLPIFTMLFFRAECSFFAHCAAFYASLLWTFAFIFRRTKRKSRQSQSLSFSTWAELSFSLQLNTVELP